MIAALGPAETQPNIDRHLAKPVEPGNLVEEVAGLLRSRRDQVASLAYSR